MERGQSAENIAFGMGAALLQKVDRDTQRFAMKASAICIDGDWRDVYKDPVTDPGKRSKAGRLALVKQNGEWGSVRLDQADPDQNRLFEVFRNGKLLRDWSLEEVRQQAQLFSS